MKLSRREKILLAVAMFLMLASIYIKFIFLPAWHKYHQLETVFNEQQTELEKVMADKKNIDPILQLINEKNTEIAYSELALPSSPKLPEVIVQIESFALASGVNIREIVFNNERDARREKGSIQKDYLETKISLEVNGTYNEIIKFLKCFEQSDRLYLVKNISIARDFGNREDLLVTMDLSVYSILYGGKSAEELYHYSFIDDDFGSLNPFQPISDMPRNQAGNRDILYEGTSLQIDVFKQFLDNYIKEMIEGGIME